MNLARLPENPWRVSAEGPVEEQLVAAKKRWTEGPDAEEMDNTAVAVVLVYHKARMVGLGSLERTEGEGEKRSVVTNTSGS